MVEHQCQANLSKLTIGITSWTFNHNPLIAGGGMPKEHALGSLLKLLMHGATMYLKLSGGTGPFRLTSGWSVEHF